MEEYFKTLPQENGECSFDPWDAFCKTGLDIFGICVKFDLVDKYNPDLLRAAMQWENHARGLDEGTWVDMGCGEYAELPNIERREKRLNLLSLAYEKLNRFEGSIEEDLKRAKMVEITKRTLIITKRTRELELLNSTASGMGDYNGIGLARGLESVKNLLEWYHTDAEFVAPLVNGKTPAIPCGNGWGQGGKQLPERLNTPEANKWLDKARDAGLLDEGYQPTGKLGTRAMQAYFAELFGEKAGIHRGKYAAFEELWGIKHMAKERYEAREIKGRVKGGEVVEAFFGVNPAKH